MALSFIKMLALLIGIMHHTPTEVAAYTLIECPHEHCYDATNGDSEFHLIFDETIVQNWNDAQLRAGDKVYAISLKNEEHTLVRIIKAD